MPRRRFDQVLSWAVLVSAAVIFSAASRPVVGQEEGRAVKAATAKKANKARGRLPRYYRHVVSQKQRDRIYELIKSSSEHPTAKWIYDKLRQDFPSLSMGNVYRNINILIDDDQIISREFGDGIVHYDAIVSTHYHFICKECNTITDFSLPVQDEIMKMAQKKTKNIVMSHTIQFFGICEKCNGG